MKILTPEQKLKNKSYARSYYLKNKHKKLKRMSEYRLTDKYKAYEKAYHSSEEYKTRRRIYHATEKAKAIRRKYQQSERYKFLYKKYRATGKWRGYSIKYRGSVKGKTSILNRHLKNNFNITVARYNEIFKEQKGVCAVCQGDNEFGFRLAVDHDHETGQVRGLLCQRCNTALGYARDNPYNLMRLAGYLLGLD